MKLVHWLLHFVQRGGNWAGPHRRNSSPINDHYTNHRNRFFAEMVVSAWNSVPANVNFSTVTTFKHSICWCWLQWIFEVLIASVNAKFSFSFLRVWCTGFLVRYTSFSSLCVFTITGMCILWNCVLLFNFNFC